MGNSLKSRWLLVAAAGFGFLALILDRYHGLCITGALFSSILFWSENEGAGSAGDDAGLGVEG